MNVSLFITLIVVALACSGCSASSNAQARKRAADREVNTKNLEGTTDVLKNYRLPDPRPTKDAKQVLKQSAPSVKAAPGDRK